MYIIYMSFPRVSPSNKHSTWYALNEMLPYRVLATRRHSRKRRVYVTKPQTAVAKRQVQRQKTMPNPFLLTMLHVKLHVLICLFHQFMYHASFTVYTQHFVSPTCIQNVFTYIFRKNAASLLKLMMQVKWELNPKLKCRHYTMNNCYCKHSHTVHMYNLHIQLQCTCSCT